MPCSWRRESVDQRRRSAVVSPFIASTPALITALTDCGDVVVVGLRAGRQPPGRGGDVANGHLHRPLGRGAWPLDLGGGGSPPLGDARR